MDLFFSGGFNQIMLKMRGIEWFPLHSVMSLVLRKPVFGPTRSDTNRAVQSLNMARGLKFQIQKEEGLYYPCSENKGADQLRGIPRS